MFEKKELKEEALEKVFGGMVYSHDYNLKITYKDNEEDTETKEELIYLGFTPYTADQLDSKARTWCQTNNKVYVSYSLSVVR